MNEKRIPASSEIEEPTKPETADNIPEVQYDDRPDLAEPISSNVETKISDATSNSLIGNFDTPIGESEERYAEALKYEIFGLRQEMLQYMHHQFLVENFALTAGAVAFSYMLTVNSGESQTFYSNQSIESPDSSNVVETANLAQYSVTVYNYPDFFKAVFLSVVILMILHFGYGRLKLLRYRISRLGLYIYLREKLYPSRLGWEHFVYNFRKADLAKLTTQYFDAARGTIPLQRSKSLNALVKEIDKSPGRFTGNLYWRWRIIITIAYLGCAAQLFFVGSEVDEIRDFFCQLPKAHLICSDASEFTQ